MLLTPLEPLLHTAARRHANFVPRITNYLTTNNVQLGATYSVAKASTTKYNDALIAAAGFLNTNPEEIVIGPSTTQLFANLAQTLEFSEGSEIVLSALDHEANLASWLRMAKRQKLVVKWWNGKSSTAGTSPKLSSENLAPLLNEKTVFVACTHTSNVLGTIHDIKSIANTIHTRTKAFLCVDGVAHAPHREVDVKDLGVDFYSFSWYKVFGPHIAMLYASNTAQEKMGSLGHYFHDPKEGLGAKLNLAASSYELVATVPEIIAYIGVPPNHKKTWKEIAEHEERLSKILLDYLHGRKDVTIHGSASHSRDQRVSVISFTTAGKSSRAVVEAVDTQSVYGIRWGHFYSKRLVEEVLGLDEDGVVRVSMVHYNTEEEVKGLVGLLDDVLGKGEN